jgi:hypothetical protein
MSENAKYPPKFEKDKIDKFIELLDIENPHPSSRRYYGADHDPFANIRSSMDFGTPGWIGAFIRLNDKIIRIKNFAKRRQLANESVEDSMRDIAVYALIGLVMYEEESKSKLLKGKIVETIERSPFVVEESEDELVELY